MTSPLSWSYCCLHCFLSAASDCLGAPFWTAGCFFSAGHALRVVGRVRDTAGRRPATGPMAAFVSQWLNSSLVMLESPTLATLFEGTSSPQPATSAAQTGEGQVASEREAMSRGKVISRCLGLESQARLKVPPSAAAGASGGW